MKLSKMSVLRRIFLNLPILTRRIEFIRSISSIIRPQNQLNSHLSLCKKQFSSFSSPPPVTTDELNEELFWENLSTSLQLDELTERNKLDTADLARAERRVFVLQLRMQFKSKSRQSTKPELQLAESVSLVETLRNWRVIDHYIVGMKHSYSKEMFGSGNQV